MDSARQACHSFDPNTPVLMADGTTKPIKDVKVGDQVTATDPASGTTGARAVTTLHSNLDTELTDVTVSTEPESAAGKAGTGQGKGDRSTRGPTISVLETTAHHPFWDATTGAWVDAATLVAGESTLVGPDGQFQYVTKVGNFTGSEVMRDLTVAEIHTYYVVAGNEPVLVHNCDFIGPLDHVALGVNPRGKPLNVEDFAESRQARHFMNTPGWREEVTKAAERATRGEGRISFMIDGLPGANRGPQEVLRRIMEAQKRNEKIGATQWEMLEIARVGAWGKVDFFRFNRRQNDWVKL